MRRGLADTSVFIAREQQRALATLPDELALSVVTLGELELGVLAAPHPEVRARRADTLDLARAAEALPVRESTVGCFARLVHDCRAAGVRATVLDALIAATAVDHGIPVVSQDHGFEAMAAAHGPLEVLLV